MKYNILTFMVFVLGVVATTFAQVNIFKTAKPFNDITSSPYLVQSKRISYDNVQTSLSSFGKTNLNTANFAGEYFLHDNMLVQLVVITQKDAMHFQPLVKVQEYFRTTASGGMSEPIETYFTDFIKNYTGHKAYVSYFKNNGRRISFVIQDNLGRYAIDGTIYYKKSDSNKAINFINPLLSSIAFK